MKHTDLRKILYMDSLIQRKCTGSPEHFAQKLDLSRSAFFEYLAYMRYDLMLDISYNNYNETYYYEGRNLCSVLNDMRCSICREKKCLEQELIV